MFIVHIGSNNAWRIDRNNYRMYRMVKTQKRKGLNLEEEMMADDGKKMDREVFKFSYKPFFTYRVLSNGRWKNRPYYGFGKRQALASIIRISPK